MILSLHKYFTHAARAQTQSLRCAHSSRILIQLLKCTRAAMESPTNIIVTPRATHTQTPAHVFSSLKCMRKIIRNFTTKSSQTINGILHISVYK